MLKDTLISLYIFFYSLVCGCGADVRDSGFERLKPSYKIRKIGKVPFQIPEGSGLIPAHNQTLWTINDGGNSNELYRITYQGEIVETVAIHGARNVDWEDLAKDTLGNIYIGDFGNNANNRTDLCIYKVRENDKKLLGQIRFSYPDQSTFPPPIQNKNFDCETMIWQNGHLYLFSKDWSNRKISKLYRLPDQPGTYTATLLDSLKINTWITGGAINHSHVALSGYGKIYLFQKTDTITSFPNNRYCLPFRRSAQSEAIVFIGKNQFIISNEQGKLFLGKPKK